ncbi:MAG: zinc ribbon domain-containing protein [Thermodesulfobacteriota bacterium]|nr:zinc ribbon domain-containing protein [Thermodesulfobacteriota bacterium]
MVGIVAGGAYIPLWRLSRGAIGEGLGGEKAIAGFDEDSITMAVAATADCLTGFDREAVDGLFLATTTSPYKEKLGASIVATAADLRRDIITADFSNSIRAGTIALRAAVDAVKSGSARQVVVVAADCRLGMPGSIWESNCGDGAVAFLIGAFGVIAEVEETYSVCDDIMDVWRTEDDRFIRSWENRFITSEGYGRISREAVSGLIRNCNLTERDFSRAVLGIPDPRTQAAVAKGLGFDVRTGLQDSMSLQCGDTGAAYSLMLLQGALEDSVPNDRCLVLSYGNGGDAMAVRVTAHITDRKGNRGIKGCLESKKVIEDYRVYARWRGLLPAERPARLAGLASSPAQWRESEENTRLYGGKCSVCGTVQYPPQKVCTRCHTRGQSESIRLSDKKGRLYTYAIDYTSWTPEIASITAIVNFEGGGRIECPMVDATEEELKVDMPVNMSFRKLDFREEEGINIYSWKCVPARG